MSVRCLGFRVWGLVRTRVLHTHPHTHMNARTHRHDEHPQMRTVPCASLLAPWTDYQVFTCGGVDYTSFAAVKDAFVGGKLDEPTLKAALIDAVNKLLDPVRKHFR